jgi:short-subunit dehydrogenase
MAAVHLTLARLLQMLECDSGTIVTVSSMGGRMGISGEAAYCASKFALSGCSESLGDVIWAVQLGRSPNLGRVPG